MPTVSTFSAETRTITIAAPPEAVFAVVADGARLPEWAPAFASRATHEAGERWLIGEGDGRFAILLRADEAARTVDLLSPDDPRRGAFLRVLPNGDGAELLFTLFFGAVGDEAVAAQMTTVEEELVAVRSLAARAGNATAGLSGTA